MKKSIVFIGLTFFSSWLLAGIFYFFGGRWNTPSATIVAAAYMFAPMTSAIIVQKFIYGEPVKKPLGISFKLNRWFLVAWLLPLFWSIASAGVSLLFPGVEYSPNMEGMFERFREILPPEQMEQMKAQAASSFVHPVFLALIMGLVAGVTINAVAGFGEELGWRGLLVHEWQNMGFWKSSALIGFVWGIWHAPFILQGHNYPQHRVAGVFMMIIWCMLMSPIFSYVRLRAKSVIAAAILHGSLNGTAGLSIMMLKGGNDMIIGLPGIAGLVVMIFVNIGLACHLGWARKDRQ